MDLKLAEYICTIAEERSISRAAEKLFLSQPALSQQLLKLENELGTPLFIRQNRSVIPTYAGEVYVANALKALNLRNQTYRQIQEIRSSTRGVIKIGVSPGRVPMMISRIMHDFYTSYPNINIHLAESPYANIEELLKKGMLDIGFTAYTDVALRANIPLSYLTLSKEDIHVILSERNPLFAQVNAMAKPAPDGNDYPTIDVAIFRDAPFALPLKGAKIRTIAEETFTAAGITPSILFEVNDMRAIYTTVRNSNFCSFVASDYFPLEGRVAHFRLNPERFWQFSVCWNPNHYVTEAEKYFIELCRRYTQQETEEKSYRVACLRKNNKTV